MSTMSIGSVPMDGTFFGVPFLYDIKNQEYLLPDGQRFDCDDRREMERYIMKNLSAFEPVVMQAVKRKSEMLAKDLEDRIKSDKIKADLESIIEKSIAKTLKEDYNTSSTTASTGTPTSFTAEELNKSVKKLREIWAVSPQEEMARKAAVEENKKIQLRWDKEFNKQVLNLVEKAIQRGMIQYTIKESMSVYEPRVLTSAVTSQKSRVIVITYDKYDKSGYMKLREQCEAAVRQGMEPPKLIQIPPRFVSR